MPCQIDRRVVSNRDNGSLRFEERYHEPHRGRHGEVSGASVHHHGSDEAEEVASGKRYRGVRMNHRTYRSGIEFPNPAVRHPKSRNERVRRTADCP